MMPSIWHFLTTFFVLLTSLMKKINANFVSVQPWFYSDFLLLNSVDMVKHLNGKGVGGGSKKRGKVSTSFIDGPSEGAGDLGHAPVAH